MIRRLVTMLSSASLVLAAGAAHAQAFEPSELDFSGLLASLGIVLGLIAVAAFVVKRTPLGAAGRQSGPLKVLAALPLGPKERLLLVEARGTELLVAIGPNGVAIAPAHPAEVGADGAAEPFAGGAGVLERTLGELR
jgi:flagellar protein FliO/FliZ